MAALVSASLAAQQSARNAGAYRIAGTVIDSSSGDPVQRAVVSLLAASDSRPVASTVTDSEGRFAFDGMAAAKYPLTASKRGYRTTFYREHDGYSTAIVAGAGQDTAHLIFFLAPGSELHGVVSGDGGDPVEGARVLLFRKPRFATQEDHTLQVDATVTDDTGAYEFSNLADGDYFVAVTAQPWYASRRAGNPPAATQGASGTSDLDVAYPITYFDLTTEENAAMPITLARGAREAADIHLHAVPALRIAVDRIRRADGGIARPQLQQIVFGTPIFAESVGFLEAFKTGKAEFNGIAPGQYELTMSDPPRIVDLNATQSEQVDPNAGSPTVAVTGTLRMPEGRMPPEEGHVFLRPKEGSLSHVNLAAQLRKGVFHLDSVAPGLWSLAVESEGKMLPVLGVGDGSALQAGNTIAVRDHAVNIVVAIGEGSARIDGFARKGEKGFGGAMVVLVPKKSGNWETLARRDQSDSDGSFSLREIVPGQYTVVAIEDGWGLDWTQPGALARYLPRGTAVTVHDSSQETVHLAGPVAVQAR